MELNLAAREDDFEFDYLFEKFSQDIDEFQKTCIEDIISDAAANHEEFIDTFFSFIDSRGNNSNEPSQSESIINLIQQDFEEFERAELPPYQADASGVQPKEETQEMIDELRQETWGYSDFCCSVGGVELFLNHRMKGVAAYGSGDLAYPPFGCGSVVRYFFCGQTRNAKENRPRKRIKRKYRGVKLSEEEAARKREENKIKNRETAAKSHDMKLAREARMHSMYLKLHQKNEHLKKQIMFLEFHERINIPPKPLKRTISALV